MNSPGPSAEGGPSSARRATLALLLLAPAIPELLTGSTPITNLVVNPLQFAVSFGLDIGLYGTGALLIREFAVAYRKGWASILLLGAAYGIAEEGLAVHTFFQRTGGPVNALGSYGHAFGVNWLWALGLTIFHATYSIALPILLTQLWFPTVRSKRFLARWGVVTTAGVYLAEVLIFSLVVPHGPTRGALAFFLVVIFALLLAAWWAPVGALRVPAGRARIGRVGLLLLGTAGFDAWVLVLLLAATRSVPAVAAGGILIGMDLVALALVTTRVGVEDLDRSKYYFATGMLAVLFFWDAIVEFSVPGILGVAALFAYLQYRLGQKLLRRGSPSPGALGDALP